METLRINRLMLAAVAILVGLACWMGWGLGQNTEAHNIGWKWDTSSTATMTNINTSYTQQIVNARNDYHINTDLAVGWCAFPCQANIYHESVQRSMHAWAGAADSYSNGQLCDPSRGNCNESSKKVNLAYIRWNSHYGPQPNDYANYIARHEMGHVFGLRHVPCEAGSSGHKSVMGVNCSYSAPTRLQSHDISDIDSKY